MDAQVSSTNSFSDFIEQVQESPPVEENIIEGGDFLTEAHEAEHVPTCDICGWKPRKHCKDKEKALLTHMKKKHGEGATQKVTFKEVPVQQVVQDIVDLDFNALNEDAQKQRLVEDLDVLRAKFPDVYKVPIYTYPETPLHTLQRYKNTFQRLISDRISSGVAFNCLVALGKGAERGTAMLGVADLEGYASDLIEKEREIMEILQECIDTNIISVRDIDPSMKLGVLLCNIGINRAAQNKKKFVVDASA